MTPLSDPLIDSRNGLSRVGELPAQPVAEATILPAPLPRSWACRVQLGESVSVAVRVPLPLAVFPGAKLGRLAPAAVSVIKPSAGDAVARKMASVVAGRTARLQIGLTNLLTTRTLRPR